MSECTHQHRFTLANILIRVILFIIFISSTAFSQDSKSVLEDALENFARHQYDKIVQLLTDLPPARFPDKSQQVLGYELLAQAYFYTGVTDSVKSTVNRLLDLQPEYLVQTPQYPQTYIDLIDEVREERAAAKSGSLLTNQWVWLGGAAVTGLTLFLILNKEDSKQIPTLPEAPDPPN
jgi:hypothetical protein